MLFFSKKNRHIVTTYYYFYYICDRIKLISTFSLLIIREEIAMVKRVKKAHEQDDHEFDNVYNCDADERYDGVDSSIWYN